MVEKEQIRREIRKKLQEMKPVVKQKLAHDGYFGISITSNQIKQNIPFRDFNQVNQSSSFRLS